jgi:hypothetical protein
VLCRNHFGLGLCSESPVGEEVSQVVTGVACEAFVKAGNCFFAVHAFGYCAGGHVVECHFVSLSWLLMTLVYRTRHDRASPNTTFFKLFFCRFVRLKPDQMPSGAEESRTPVLDSSCEGFAAKSKPSGPSPKYKLGAWLSRKKPSHSSGQGINIALTVASKMTWCHITEEIVAWVGRSFWTLSTT